jgi:RNA polymerase sigma-70 factor (ECF subfamily)
LVDKNKIKELQLRIANEFDQLAARELFNYFHPKLVRFAVLYTSSIHSANDIVSEVFVKVFRNREKMAEINDMQFYLFRAVKNQCLTFIGQQKKMASIDDLDWDQGGIALEVRNPENELLTAELTKRIEDIIISFPPQRKLIYKMIIVDGLKYREAAEMLDLSIKTIENHLLLAVKFLREEITKYLQDKDVDPGYISKYFKKK